MIFKTQKKALFPIAPLIIFCLNFFAILFIFFIVIATLNISAGFLADIPKAKQVSSIPNNHLNVSLTYVNSKEKKQIISYFNNKLIEFSNLELVLISFIRERNFKSNELILSLRVDKNVPYKFLIAIYEVAKRLDLRVNHVVESD